MQRIIVYIDGFNLYYCALKNTGYKWLDLEAMCRNLLNPAAHDIVAVKYFTARVQARPDDPSAPTRQDAYWRALQAYCPKVQIIPGFFLQSVKMSHLAPEAGHGCVKTIKTEEKGSDVNLSVHLLNDAWMDQYDCAVLISNDSDMYESVNLARSKCGKRVGWIFPVTTTSHKMHLSKKLSPVMDFKLQLTEPVLANSQLPDPIPGTTIHKPAGW